MEKATDEESEVLVLFLTYNPVVLYSISHRAPFDNEYFITSPLLSRNELITDLI